MTDQPSTSTYLTPSITPRPGSAQEVKPTLLALHGSGSNATIHTVQLARVSRLLRPQFDILSLEAPFPSAAGPGVLPFFEGCGPFKRWIPPSDKVSTAGTKTGEASGSMAPEVEDLIRSTVTKIQSEGGRIVGLIGFSQGTRVVAGLLKGTEIRRALGEQDRKDLDWLDFDFALSVCGSYPPPLLPSSMLAALESSSIPPAKQTALVQSKIAIPTLHVQGAQDEWAWAGKLLIEGTYASDEGTSEVSEFTMGHHYPVQAEDTERIKSWVVETYQRTSEGREKR